MTRMKRTLVASLLLCCLPTVAWAVGPTCSVALPCAITWNANTEPDMKEYRVYLSQVSGTYGTVPKVVVQHPGTTTGTVGLGVLPSGQYFVTVRAVDTALNESLKSNEVAFVFDNAPPAPPVVTITVTVP